MTALRHASPELCLKVCAEMLLSGGICLQSDSVDVLKGCAGPVHRCSHGSCSGNVTLKWLKGFTVKLCFTCFFDPSWVSASGKSFPDLLCWSPLACVFDVDVFLSPESPVSSVYIKAIIPCEGGLFTISFIMQRPAPLWGAFTSKPATTDQTWVLGNIYWH